MRRLSILILIALTLWSGLAQAADLDFEQLFQDELLIEIGEAEGDLRPEEVLLTQEGLDLGGRYNLGINASRIYFGDGDSKDAFRLTLGGDLFLDARPDPRFRILGKADFSAQIGLESGAQGEAAGPSCTFKLAELFSDFNYQNKIFFRVGKQRAKWGVGYFFSPADLISVGRIDPQDPQARLEGPAALKIHYPRGSDNYYLYLLLGPREQPGQPAVAPKAEFVLGRSELSLGAFYQKEKAPRAMATLSASAGGLSIFGEAVLSKGSDKLFFEGLEFVKKDGWFWHLTGGTSFNRSDPDGLFNFSGALQYYFDGEGTGLGDKIFRPLDRHRLAAAAAWSQIYGSGFSASVFLESNLSDKSGMVNCTLSLPSSGSISPSVGVSFNYGEAGTEFGLTGKRITTLFASLSLGGGELVWN